MSFGIFDLDLPQNGPVPIPSTKYDYVNKNSQKGPFSVLSNYAIADHRYFGIIYISCKGGKGLRTYWIYVKHNHPEEGFYAKRNERDTYQINPVRLAVDANYFETIVPNTRRRIIK